MTETLAPPAPSPIAPERKTGRKGRRIVITFTILVLFVLGGFSFISAFLMSMMGGDVYTGGPYIALVRVRGLIVDAEPILSQIAYHRDNPEVRAMVARIDTPGGAVGASQEIMRELNRLRDGSGPGGRSIPVVASFGNAAASGGYYIACGADRIVTNPGTITGSIGVILSSPEFSRLFQLLGVAYNTVTSGDFKDTGSMARPMTDEERALLQATIDDVHHQFVDAIVQGRRQAVADVLRRRMADEALTSMTATTTASVPVVTEEAVRQHIESIADGRILTGRFALEAGLADQEGNFRDAIDLACQLAGMPLDTQVYEKKTPRSLMEVLMESAAEALPSLTQSTAPSIQLRSEWP